MFFNKYACIYRLYKEYTIVYYFNVITYVHGLNLRIRTKVGTEELSRLFNHTFVCVI